MTNVDPAAFIAGMADSVSTIRTLCSAISGASTRHGNLPSATPNVAMSDIAAEERFAERMGEAWLVPVRDTHTFGGMTLVAASDYGECYAQLFAGERAPVFGHLVMVRAALEACVVSSWLNDPRIETVQRIKRGLCELVYSTWEVRRLNLDEQDQSTASNMTKYERSPTGR